MRLHTSCLLSSICMFFHGKTFQLWIEYGAILFLLIFSGRQSALDCIYHVQLLRKPLMWKIIWNYLLSLVEIHRVLHGNQWMGSSDFGSLNKMTSQTAGWGLKTKQDNKIKSRRTWTWTNKWALAVCVWGHLVFEHMLMLWAKLLINLKLKLGPR